ncbi:ankyrin [Corynespora cassiicola Philippines]|uniref:Ankyrin n=1 Tax=Corynespora cassiicola Philippines TaxID=1448308 RepID=A0A2T2PCC8_CORCC|nr:ankyrin [Corynespora cassiicola Philippines]
MSVRHREEVWNRHKAAIQTLYLDEDRKLLGTGGVIEQMAELHDFHATKAQYERQFKKWDFRKNRTKKEWEAIAHQVAKRKRDNKESEVMIDGAIVCSKRLKKEVSRYGYVTAFPHLGQPKTPPSMCKISHVVFTPPSQDSTLKWPPSLPWFRLVGKYLSGASILTSHLPSGSTQFSETLHKASRLLLNNQILTHSRDMAISQGAEKLACIMPEESTGQSRELAYSIVSMASSGTSLASFKVLLYSISNKLDDNSVDYRIIMKIASKFVVAITDHRAITFNDVCAEPSLVALLEKFQEIACNSSNLRILESLLKFKMSPNRAIRHHESGAQLSPIQIAAIENDVELANLLLRYGADVDATGLPNQPTALTIALVSQHRAVCRFLLLSNPNLNHQFDLNSFDFEFSEWDPEDNEPYISYIGPCTPLSIIFSTPWNPLNDRDEYYDHEEIPLHADARNKYVEFLDKVLDTAARGFPNDTIPEEYLAHLIYIASRKLCEPAIMRVALEAIILRGGDINTESIHGILPISVQCMSYESPERCMTLLSLGAKPTLPRASSYFNIRPTILHRAALDGDIKTVCMLLELEVDVNHYIHFQTADHKICADILGIDPSEEYFNTDRHQRWGQYHTPLQFALASYDFDVLDRHFEKKVKVAKILLSKGATLSKFDLVTAVGLRNLGLIQHLHRLGASVDEVSPWGSTALEESISLGLQDISRYLIESGAKINGSEVRFAIRSKFPTEFINLLRSYQRSFKKYILGEIFFSGDEEIISKILTIQQLDFNPVILGGAILAMNHTDDLSHKKWLEGILREYCNSIPVTELSETQRMGITTSIIMAAFYDHDDIFHLLIERFSASMAQVCFSTMESVFEFFITYRRRLNDSELLAQFEGTRFVKPPPLALAAEMSEQFRTSQFFQGSMGIKKLIDYGFKPDALTVLYSIFRGRRDLLKTLLANGADPNRRYSQMDSPLQMAIRQCEEKGTEVVQDLLECGADVNAEPPPRPWIYWAPRTALQLAVECGNMELVRCLISKGADVNAAAAHDSGATALQVAAGKGFIGLAKILIEEGADIDAKRAIIRGRTALEIAAEHGRIDMLQLLLSGPPRASTEGEFSLQYIRSIKMAERNGHMSAATLLRDHRPWSLEDQILYENETLEDGILLLKQGQFFDRPLRDNIDQLGNRLDDIVWENTDNDDGTGSSEYDGDLAEPHFEGSENTALFLDESEDLGIRDEVFDIYESSTTVDEAEEIGDDLEVRWQAFEKGLLEAGIVVDV